MNNSFLLHQIQKTNNFDPNLISRQYKLNLMADFMRLKYDNPKKKQTKIANQLSYSSSTFQRYRNDKNMLSPYKIQSNNNNKRTKKASKRNSDNNSHRERDLRRPQMTSIGLGTTQTNTKSNTKNQNLLKAGSIQENIEINEQYLDEILDNNDI